MRKLSEAETRERFWGEIRARLVNGETGRALARAFGVTPTTISYIKTGRTWRA